MEPINKLTAAEITNLWNSYLTNTMTFWVTQYFIAKTQDKELHAILEYAEEIASIEVDKSESFLVKANQPLPQKFGKTDVDLNAPAICTDNFTAIIKYQLCQAAHIVYSLSLSTSTRKDIREFYQECLKNSAELFNRLADFLIKKGLHQPPIYISTPNIAEKVSDQHFLDGWFGERRSVNSAEITQLEYNFRATEFHKTFLKSLAKVTPSKDIQKHFHRGADILEKHLDIFQSILTENGLPRLPTWESELTNTKVTPFSERLMLYKMTLLASEASGRYGTSLSSVQRRDLGGHYTRLIAEVLKYGEDSANLMIKHGFMDHLPLAKNNNSS
ncbi:DUF3231 family protein [Mesobacillus harenae]|uniref:DUF3231 family protein n=1 Tax=Mesobacillus harenae TaxID=2213203 RepID=UPI001580B965|nr:DUF3231 family protein [Mesobacillus harenae]